MRSIVGNILLIEGGICSSSRAERERERSGCLTRPVWRRLRCVGGRRLELIGNVIVSGESLAAVLHLGQQLQRLLLLLGGVVAQQVGGRGQDRGSAGARHQVEADGERDVYEGAVVLFVLLLQWQDELGGPVAEADDCGTL